MSIFVVMRRVDVHNHASGYIAGESPGGIVTFDDVPGRAEVMLIRRSTAELERRTISAGDGTYRFSTLPLGVKFDVIGRDPTDSWGDVIVGRVMPYAPPQITTASLAFTVGSAATAQMTSLYGGQELTWSIDTLPPGLNMDATGLWSGTPTTAGNTAVVVTVEDEFGETGSRSYAVVVT